MEDVAVIFGQPQLLVVDLPYGDGEEEFAQQGIAMHHMHTHTHTHTFCNCMES